ncbi:MAG TPA: hypothetical protein VH817_00165 [Thermoleophilaceae bacterium]
MSAVRRLCLGALGILGCVLVLAPAAAQARRHPSPNGRHNISIATSDNPVVAGDQLAIFGRLRGPNNGNRMVVLWHRINPRRFFSPIQRTRTDAHGFYAFLRPNGVVNTNRNWYVKSLRARSRTVHEKVFSLVTLSGPADGSNLETGPAHKVTFSGTVSPFAVGDRVILQRQNANSGKGWHRIDQTRVRPGGTYTINHTFRVPGDANVRVVVGATRRNIRSVSNVLSYEVSQAQNPALTLNSSANPLTVGQATTLTGTVQGGAGQQVNLLARTVGGQFQQVATTVADGSGNYSFVQVPLHNTLYQVQSGGKKSAQLFEGVKFLLSASESPSTVSAGQSVTFSGTVAPDATGHVIYLQRQNPNGNGFHTVQVQNVGAGSVYTITRRLFVPGTKVFRVFIPGGPLNQGAASQTFTITVNPAPPQQVNDSQPDTTNEGQ